VDGRGGPAGSSPAGTEFSKWDIGGVAPEAQSHRSFLVLFFKKEPLP
jgi:hypothetical protein